MYSENLRNQGHEAAVTQKTGLLLDPYFSATKAHWLLENVEGLRARVQAGEVLLGTIDTYLIYRLSGAQCLCDGRHQCRPHHTL